MERKTTKMLAIVAVIGLCAVALIGAGYAAFAGSASTYNQGNTAEAGYIEIGNSVWTAMASGVDSNFNTYTAQTGKVYYFNGASSTVDSKTAISLATKTVTLTNQTAGDISSVQVSIKATTAFTNTDFVYFFGVTIGQNTVYITPTTANTPVTQTLAIDLEATEGVQALATGATTDVTYTLYIGYVADKYIPEAMIGDITAQAVGQNDIPAKMANAGPSDMASTDFGFTIAVPNA